MIFPWFHPFFLNSMSFPWLENGPWNFQVFQVLWEPCFNYPELIALEKASKQKYQALNICTTLETYCLHMGHSAIRLPHWVQVTMWPHSNKTQSMMASIHILHISPSWGGQWLPGSPPLVLLLPALSLTETTTTIYVYIIHTCIMQRRIKLRGFV